MQNVSSQLQFIIVYCLFSYRDTSYSIEQRKAVQSYPSSYSRPEPSISTYSRPDPPSAYSRPEPSTSTYSRPDPPSTYSRPDHLSAASTYSRTDPVTSTYSRPDPVTSTYSRPDPPSSTYSRPDPITSTYSRPDPPTSSYIRPDPLTSTYSRPDPIASSPYSRADAVVASSPYSGIEPTTSTYLRPEASTYSRVDAAISSAYSSRADPPLSSSSSTYPRQETYSRHDSGSSYSRPLEPAVIVPSSSSAAYVRPETDLTSGLYSSKNNLSYSRTDLSSYTRPDYGGSDLAYSKPEVRVYMYAYSQMCDQRPYIYID